MSFKAMGSDIEALFESLDSTFSFLSGPPLPSWTSPGEGLLRLEVEVPGVKPEAIDVRYRDAGSASRVRVEWTDRLGHAHRNEWDVSGAIGSFEAVLNDGVLTLDVSVEEGDPDWVGVPVAGPGADRKSFRKFA